MQLLLETLLPGKTVTLLLLLCVQGSSHVHDLRVDWHCVPASFSFAVVLKGRFFSWAIPTHVMALTLSPSVLVVLREKGEVEGQRFLPSSLVVQETSVEETYL